MVLTAAAVQSKTAISTEGAQVFVCLLGEGGRQEYGQSCYCQQPT